METKDFILSYSSECNICVNWGKNQRKRNLNNWLMKKFLNMKKMLSNGRRIIFIVEIIYLIVFLMICMIIMIKLTNQPKRYGRHWIKNMTQRKLDPRNKHVADFSNFKWLKASPWWNEPMNSKWFHKMFDLKAFE